MYNKIFSEERLRRYYIDSTYTEEDAIASYLRNIALSEALYPAIAILEVNLRNNIYNSISKNIMTDWLDESTVWLLDPEKDQIKNAKYKVQKLRKTLTQGQTISHLTLGFWVSLLKKAYKPNIWNKANVFEDTFPYFQIKTSNRLAVIEPELKKVLILRNRIFHHEPIINHPGGLDITFNSLIYVMMWLSQDSKPLLDRINRFNDVFNTKVTDYKHVIKYTRV